MEDRATKITILRRVQWKDYEPGEATVEVYAKDDDHNVIDEAQDLLTKALKASVYAAMRAKEEILQEIDAAKSKRVEPEKQPDEEAPADDDILAEPAAETDQDKADAADGLLYEGPAPAPETIAEGREPGKPTPGKQRRTKKQMEEDAEFFNKQGAEVEESDDAAVEEAPADDLDGLLGEEAPAVTEEDVKRVVQKTAARVGAPAVRDVLNKLGVAKVSQVPEAQWPAFVKTLEGLEGTDSLL